MKTRMPVLVAILLVAGIISAGLFLYNKKAAQREFSNPDVLLNLPNGWNVEVKDDSHCYQINIINNGVQEENISKYLFEKVYGGKASGEIKDLNTFNINSPKVYDLGQQGVGNFNTVYVQSKSNNIYVVEINSIIPEGKEAKTSCQNYNSLIQSIVRTLLEK